MNIQKLQQGGSISSFFVTTQYPQYKSTQGRQSSPRQASTQKEDDGLKDFMKNLVASTEKIKGMPSDIKNFTKRVQLFLQDMQMFPNVSLADRYMQYVSLMSSIPIAENNNSDFEKTRENLVKKDALGEVAVSGNKVLVVDKDYNVNGVPVSNFLKNKEKYKPITYGNLLWMRHELPKYANNQTILQFAQNGYGINEIHKMIKDRISDVKSTTRRYKGQVIKQQGDIIQGLSKLRTDDAKKLIQQQGMTLDGFYKISTMDKNSVEQIQAALSYIYGTLPTEARTILQIRGGNAENPEQGAMMLLAKYAASMHDIESEVEVEYDTTLNKGTIEDINGTTAKEQAKQQKDELSKMKVNIPLLFAAGKGNPTQFEVLSGNASTYCIGTAMPITDKANNSMGPRVTLKKVAQGNYSGVLDFSKATIAGKPLPTSMFDRTIVTDGDIIKVDFPIDDNGNPDIRPVTIKKKQAFDRDIKDAGIDLDNPQSITENLSKINQLLQKHGLPSAYDSNGKIIGNKWGKFGIMTGQIAYTEVDSDELTGAYKYFHEIVDDDDIKQYKDDIKAQSKLELDWDNQNWAWTGIESEYSRLLEGTIFIPIKSNVIGSAFNATAAQAQGLDEANRENNHRQKIQQTYISSNNVQQ